MTDNKSELREKIDDLIEAVMEGKYGQSTPYGKPYDPDIEVTELKDEIISLCTEHSKQSEWVSVLDELPLMYLVNDNRGGGHWYSSDAKIWVTDGVKVIETSFFQVWPDKAKALCISLDNISHWKAYAIPSPPQPEEKKCPK